MKLGTLREPGKIKSWLFTVTKRRANDWIRQQQRGYTAKEFSFMTQESANTVRY
ncbi:hypothetical protein [Paenibacillus sp. NEAU-GSW1]|uniref:hypothetical protein n=1 Tax=Paenibacillus sp. NEAU-GSW1 TaxID=2682486 RepID=UPI0012E1F2B6|nr:hypothetical protein [Paenibacillus sp. NEAU-GSW1]